MYARTLTSTLFSVFLLNWTLPSANFVCFLYNHVFNYTLFSFLKVREIMAFLFFHFPILLFFVFCRTAGVILLYVFSNLLVSMSANAGFLLSSKHFLNMIDHFCPHNSHRVHCFTLHLSYASFSLLV